MLNQSILCEFIISPLNTKLLYCKHCNRAIPAENYNQKSFCPTLVSKQSEQNNSGVKLIAKQTVNDIEQLKQLIPNIDRSILREQTPEQTCSQKQIDERLAICKGCEFYQDNSCLQCGCILSRERNYMNKLYRADQSCPIDKWGPVTTS